MIDSFCVCVLLCLFERIIYILPALKLLSHSDFIYIYLHILFFFIISIQSNLQVINLNLVSIFTIKMDEINPDSTDRDI